MRVGAAFPVLIDGESVEKFPSNISWSIFHLSFEACALYVKSSIIEEVSISSNTTKFVSVILLTLELTSKLQQVKKCTMKY